MSLQSAFRKRWIRRAHADAYASLKDEPRSRPAPSPRLSGADPYKKPPKSGPVRKHDTPKSPHKEHGPKGKHQGVGQAVHAGRIHTKLSGIFTGKNEGAGLMQNAPRPGFNVSIAGDRMDIGRRFQQLEDVSGVWEGEMEQSYMANFPDPADPRKVLRAAAEAGGANDQDAVFARYDGERQPGRGWEKAKEYTLQTPQGIIDMIDPSPKNLKAAVKMAKRFGGGQHKVKPVWTRLLERGKHY